MVATPTPTRRPVVGIRVKTTPTEQTQLFKEHLRIAHHIAHLFSSKYRIPYNELVDEAEGLLALCVAQWANTDKNGYNPTMRTPASWVYQDIYYKLLTWATRKQPRHHNFTSASMSTAHFGDENGVTTFDAPAPTHWLTGLLHTLGEDAKFICITIVNAPAEIASDVYAAKPLKPDPVTGLPASTETIGRFNKRARMAIKRELITRHGWTPARVHRAWLEVAVAL